MRTTVTGPKTTQPVHQIDTEVKPTTTPAPTQRTEADPNADAKAQGSRQHAEENKSLNDMRSQMLKNEFSDPSFRNLGQQFAKSGKTDPRSAATAVQHTWNNLPISSHGPIAYETAKNLTDQDLQTLAKTKEGREFLQKIENGMMDGNVEPAHQAQIDRIRKAHLSEALPTKELSNALPKQATTPPADGLKPGESISAKVTETGDITKPVVERTFNFSRPVTKQQAAAIIFQNGQVPKGAELVQGTANKWIVKFPNNLDARHNIARHYNSHTETVVNPPRNPTDGTFPESELTMTWVGGAPKTSNIGPPRRDLNNDMGFKITNHYTLDEGQRKVESLGKKGAGYEVSFEKPMTKDEVMKKLFDQSKISHGEVRLLPQGPEPTTRWKVEVIGEDAASAFKRDSGRAFQDANVYGKQSLPTGTPDGVRKHIENRSVPQDAVKHPPDAYVWEQDGYMMYVKTNGKGKDGYYEPQLTKMPTDKEGAIALRYYMKDKGMPPREAWQEFWKDTVEITKMKIGMIGGARTPRMIKGAPPKSSFGDAPVPSRSKVPGAPVPQPGNTIPGHKPPIPGNAPYVQPGRTPTIKSQVPPNPPQARPVVQPRNNAPVRDRTGGTGVDSQPPVPQPRVPGRGNTLPGSIKQTGQPLPEKSLPSGFPKTPGTSLTPDQVRQANDARRVGWSMTSDEHKRQWKAANPKSTQEPPIAFTTRDGRVQVDEARWVKSGQPALWGNRAGDRVSNPPPPPDKNH